MTEFTDVLVRIRAAQSGSPSVHVVETSVRESGNWPGAARFDLDSLDPNKPEEYGRDLWRQLTDSNTPMIRALDQAGLTRGASIRLRLWLDEEATDSPTVPHWVRWERLWANIGGSDWRLAVHPRVAFSRYIAVPVPDEAPPESPVFRLLFAISNPIGLAANQAIEVEKEVESFLVEFEHRGIDRRLQVELLAGRTGIGNADLHERIKKQGWEVLTGPTSINNLSKEILKGYHGLHILAHGEFDPAESFGQLLLEDHETGGKKVVKSSEMQALVTPSLQLIVFQACESASSTGEGERPFTSLGPRMIKLGVPAVVAMQDEVTMDDARVFFSEFYRTLLDEGLVDVAVNRGRQRLVNNPGSDNWSIPVLFTRLRGGRLWNADPLRQAVIDLLANLPRELDSDPPQQVIEHIRGLESYDPVEGASGPCFDLDTHTREILAKPGSMVILIGPRSAHQDFFCQRLFRDYGKAFSESQPDAPIPVLLHLCDLVGNKAAAKHWGVLQRIWQNEVSDKEKKRVKDREFVFLINGQEDAQECARAEAVEAIDRLRQSLPNCRILLVTDDQLLPILKDRFNIDARSQPILLAIQELEWAKVSTFLLEDTQEGSTKSDVSKRLRQQIFDSGLTDLTIQPKFLQFMRDLVEKGYEIKSRREVMNRFARVYLSKMENRKIPRVCLEDALRRIAFRIQTGGRNNINSTLSDLSY